MLLAVAEQQFVLARRSAFAPLREVLEQYGQSCLLLRVVTRGMQARERGLRQDVDLTDSSSCSSETPPARAMPTR